MHKKLIDTWEIKAARACATLLPIISERLMMYVEEKDDSAKIWKILLNQFHFTNDMILIQALKHIIILYIIDDDDMKAYIRDFIAGKCRIKKYRMILINIIYYTFFLLSILMIYQMIITAIESQTKVIFKVTQNCLLKK